MKPNLPFHFKFTLSIVVLALAVSAGTLIPKSACAAPGDLYVTGFYVSGPGGDSAIYVFTPPNGTPSRSITIPPSSTETSLGTGPGLLGVAFDSGSNLYVADAGVDSFVGPPQSAGSSRLLPPERRATSPAD